MSGNVIQAPFYNSGFYNNGAGGGGGGNVVEINGVKYPYVQIENQLWLAKNLDITWDGLLNFDGTIYDNDTNPRAVWYEKKQWLYGSDASDFGLLYNGFAADYIQNNFVSDGWHIPLDDDWTTLLNNVDEDPNNKLLTKGWWLYGNSTDEFGFGLKPVGQYQKTGDTYSDVYFKCFVWSQNKDSYDQKYFCSFSANNISHGSSNVMNRNGLRMGCSIRLCKNL